MASINADLHHNLTKPNKDCAPMYYSPNNKREVLIQTNRTPKYTHNNGSLNLIIPSPHRKTLSELNKKQNTKGK